MAHRLIRDDVLDSERVHRLAPPGRWLYVALLLLADDVGLLELNSFKIGRKSGIEGAEQEAFLQQMVDVDLIRPYIVAKKRYAFIPRFKQRLQIKRSKCPMPPEDILTDDPDALNKIKALAEATAVVHRKSTVGQPPEPEPEPEERDNPSLRSGFAPPPDGGVPPKAKKPRAPRPKKGDEPTPSVLAWKGYSAAYLRRYKVEPVCNARVRGQLANFVTRIPAAEVEAVAAFFVSHNGNLYVNARHPVDLLIRDAEKLRTDWATNQRTDPQLASRIAAPNETAFQRQRRESVERMTGGKVSKPAPSTKEIFDDVSDATPRLG